MWKTKLVLLFFIGKKKLLINNKQAQPKYARLIPKTNLCYYIGFKGYTSHITTCSLSGLHFALKRALTNADKKANTVMWGSCFAPHRAVFQILEEKQKMVACMEFLLDVGLVQSILLRPVWVNQQFSLFLPHLVGILAQNSKHSLDVKVKQLDVSYPCHVYLGLLYHAIFNECSYCCLWKKNSSKDLCVFLFVSFCLAIT